METPIIIGKGTSGVVFYPPLPCSNKIVICDNCVAKLMKTIEGYQEEISNNELIESVDPTNLYHIPMIGHCEGEHDSIPKEYNEYEMLIFYERAQYDLMVALRAISDIPEDRPKALDFLRKFSRLFDALVLFNEKHFVHCDIKFDNIMVDLNGEFKFIDFGLSFDDEPTDFGVFDGNYPYWPPETIYLAEDFTDTSIDDTVAFYQTNNIVKQTSGVLNKDDLQAILIDESTLSRREIYPFIDIFGLGSVLAYCCSWLGYHIETAEAVDSWYVLLEGMTNWDLDKRLTPLVARKLYNDILQLYV